MRVRGEASEIGPQENNTRASSRPASSVASAWPGPQFQVPGVTGHRVQHLGDRLECPTEAMDAHLAQCFDQGVKEAELYALDLFDQCSSLVGQLQEARSGGTVS